MHKSLQKFAPYVEKGLLRQVISPCGRLILWNYSDHCTYERAWDDVTLNARGTVYEIETGAVIARAFPKFFNYGELSEEKKAEILNATEFEAFEKMDGSLGIVYYYDGEWRVNTRGSFTSDQAIKGKEMLDNKYESAGLTKGASYLVEIIYPENKIIVDYGELEMLTFLGAYCTIAGEWEELPKLCEIVDCAASRIPIAPSYKFDSIRVLIDHLATLDHTEEGYVVRLSNGYRVKFKSAEYLALARIMSNMSPLTFWDRMENGVICREFLEQLPEEFRDECDKIADRIEAQYSSTMAEVVGDFCYVLKALDMEPHFPVINDTRKEIGMYLKENKMKHSSAIFPYLLGNDAAVERYVKKTIRPTGNIIKER